MNTGSGDFRFSYVLNYVLNYEDSRPTSGVFAREGDFEQPEYRWTFAADWVDGDWGANIAVNHIASFAQDAAVQTAGMSDIDAMTTVDARVSYIGIEKTRVTLGATNLFNEEPPFSYHDFMGFVTDIHSGQGRLVYLKMDYSF